MESSTCKRIHIGFDTYSRCHQNSKTRYQWSNKKNLYHPFFFKARSDINKNNPKAPNEHTHKVTQKTNVFNCYVFLKTVNSDVANKPFYNDKSIKIYQITQLTKFDVKTKRDDQPKTDDETCCISSQFNYLVLSKKSRRNN